MKAIERTLLAMLFVWLAVGIVLFIQEYTL